jgi:YbgC/YbaW family acyl-CoA thioester hydrolase
VIGDRFVTRAPVRFGEIDHAGVMYYPALFDRMHRAMEDFWAERIEGGLARMIDDGIGLPLRDVRASFERPFRFGEILRIEIAVRRLGEHSVTFGVELFGDEEHRVRARAELVCSVIDVKAFRSAPLPARLRGLLEPYLEPPGPPEPVA